MAENNKIPSVPKIGMKLSKPIFSLEPNELSLVVNGNIQSPNGDMFLVTNEQSNILCSKFKPNFRVIGILPINVQNRTIFFLVNPETGESEIGYINYTKYVEKPNMELGCDNCNPVIQEPKPLEDVTQYPYCTYNTIINADCLNFDINYPIEGTFSVDSNPDRGITDCITTIYFADGKNPRRYIKLEDIPQIVTGYIDECDTPFKTGELDCSKIQVQKDFDIPCIQAIEILTNGRLEAGVYQFGMAYSNANGDEFTNYTALTNPTSIFERKITIDTGYLTDKAISLQINNLDTSYNYFNLVVVKTVNNTSSAFLVGTFRVSSDNFSYVYTGNNNTKEERIDLDILLKKNPIYPIAKGVTKSNDILFWYGLTEQRQLNLQPVVAKIHPKWQTVEVEEHFYANGTNASNYVGFERDEVYPLSIQFQLSNGYETAIFPLVGYDSEYYKDEYNINVNQTKNSFNVLSNPTCNGEQLNKLWEIQNTAQVIDYTDCPSGNCEVKPYEYGDFAYWQSTATYPKNPEVWGDLCGKPIRHFKFPDCCVSHIHSNPTNKFSLSPKLHPIGIRIDVQDIKNALADAVTKGLITEQEKLQITGYKILRGNRRNSRSIVGKGLLYDIWRTPAIKFDEDAAVDVTPKQDIYYANYPYNDLTPDQFLLTAAGINIQHPYANQSFKNGRYQFLSPNLSFAKPYIGTELKLETVEYGQSKGQFAEVLKHSDYILLTDDAYVVADALAAAEVLVDILTASGGNPIDSAGAFFVQGIVLSLFQNIFKYQAQWLEIIKKFGNWKNPATYYTSVGRYNNYCCVPNSDSVRKRATIENSRYITEGNFEFSEHNQTIRFNNFKRESFAYLSIDAFDNSGNLTDNAFLPPFIFCGEDNSRFLNSDKYDGNDGTLNIDRYRNISSYYASVKNYIPDQYGTIDQIEWINTGYCGKIDWNDTNQTNLCDTVFGGDTFINRFAMKKKFPFFIQDRVNSGRDADVMYQFLSNVGKSNFFFNSEVLYTGSFSTLQNAFLAPSTRWDCDQSTKMYSRGWIYLYSYGIPYFICESDYNVDLRYGENELDKNFYPNVGDIVDWTQEYRVPISTDNYFFYNQDYSKQNKEIVSYLLPIDYKNSDSECQSHLPNRVIYSEEGTYNWLNYLSNNYYDFPLADGKLISLKGIEQQAVLVRQENVSKVFNAFITIGTSLTDAQIGANSLFRQKPREYYRTDLGFGGSDHRECISTPFGHFFVDTQNPSILQLEGDNLKDITRDPETHNKIQWFTEHLPFQISKYFPEVDVDNNYKDFGISFGWDNKYDRLFITKKDAAPHYEYINKITYDAEFKQFKLGDLIIEPTNEKYFCNKSWTIAYFPLSQHFGCFYTFIPDYYVSTEEYFQTGKTSGLWTHVSTNKSYQVFYGELHPFIIEYGIKSQLKNNTLESISYEADFQLYDNELNYFTKSDKTYNKAVIYNQNQISGNLFLTLKEKNNFYQQSQYPKITQNGREILVENVMNYFKFNNFYDMAARNNQPMLKYTCEYPFKVINEKAIDYKPKFINNKLKSDFFIIRLENTDKSLYRIEHKFGINSETKTITQ